MENCDKIIFRLDDVTIKIGITDSEGSPVDPSAGSYQLILFTDPTDRLIITHDGSGAFSSNKTKVVSKCEVIDDQVAVYINRAYFREGELQAYITNLLPDTHFDDGTQNVSGCTVRTGYYVKEK